MLTNSAPPSPFSIAQATTAPLDKRSRLSFNLTGKLTGFLGLCLATAGLLATTPAAWAGKADSQMEAEAALHLVCVKQDQQFICQSQRQESAPTHASGDVVSATATIAPQFLTVAQQDFFCNVLLGLTYLLPVGLGLGIFLYDRYAGYRSTVLKQQIEILERIWQHRSQN